MSGPDEIMQMFEGAQAQFQAASFPGWMAGYPPSEFSAQSPWGTSADLATALSDAQQDDIGNIYVDDEAEPPTYSTLSAFWSTEVQVVGGAQASQAITFPNLMAQGSRPERDADSHGAASCNPVVFGVVASSGAGSAQRPGSRARR
jgi:hypothetical protein